MSAVRRLSKSSSVDQRWIRISMGPASLASGTVNALATNRATVGSFTVAPGWGLRARQMAAPTRGATTDRRLTKLMVFTSSLHESNTFRIGHRYHGPAEETVSQSRSTQRPQRPQRRNIPGFLSVLCELCVQTSHFFTVVADALKNEAGHPKVPGPFSAVGSYRLLISINAMFQRSI